MTAAAHAAFGLRVAIAQQAMAWTTAENVDEIERSLAIAAAGGACLCVFPELALTGFHRGIREQAAHAVVERGMRRIQEACCRERIACALGTPSYGVDGAPLNSYAVVNDAGAIVSIASKAGLTPSERTFFVPGARREVVAVDGLSCTTVMCREIEDVDEIAVQLADDDIDLVFWPSLVGHPPGTVHPSAADTADLGYVARTAVLARRLGACVVQSNWPHALNTPGSTHHGESKVYAADGEVLVVLPRDEAGVAVLTLGARSYDWTPTRH